MISSPPTGRSIRLRRRPPRRSRLIREFAKAGALFQRCVGVSNARDRVFGASGQQPDYQTSSRVFTSPSFGGIQVASTAQYYRTTTMVDHDVAEMSRPKFGSCYVTSNLALVKPT